MTHHTIVCIKSVLTTMPVDGAVRTSENSELNPFDRPALEAALNIREQRGGLVTALTLGPPISDSVLYEAMAIGADRGVLVSHPALAGSDTLATSTALAAAIRRLLPADLVLFGVRTWDSDTGQVGPQVSVLLDLPLVTKVRSMNYTDGGLRVERTVDCFRETFELSSPAALTIDSGAVQPRDVGLGGIEAAFEDYTVETWDLSDIGLPPEKVGDLGSQTRVMSLKPVKRGRTCEFFEGEPGEQADNLISYLAASGLIG